MAKMIFLSIFFAEMSRIFAAEDTECPQENVGG